MASVDLTFPTQRFRDAGATREELDELRSQFRRSDVVVQRQQIEFWAGKPSSALRDYLDSRREVGDLNGASPVGLAANTSEGPETGLDGDSGGLDDDEADAADIEELADETGTEGPQGIIDEA